MHDDEILLKALRAEQKHREGARNIARSSRRENTGNYTHSRDTAKV